MGSESGYPLLLVFTLPPGWDKGGEWRACPKTTGAAGREDSRHPSADPSSVPIQLCSCV